MKIYTSSPLNGSPVYVFTDAGAKDASKDNLDLLLDCYFPTYNTPINFFLSSHGKFHFIEVEFRKLDSSSLD